MDAVIIPNLLMKQVGNERMPEHVQLAETGFEPKQFESRVLAINFYSVYST